MDNTNPWSDHPTPITRPVLKPLNISLKEERQCIAEIRAMGMNMPLNYVLANGQRATEFALQYILKHHLIRKEKKTEKKT